MELIGFIVLACLIHVGRGLEFKPNCTSICDQVDDVHETEFIGCDNSCRRSMCFEGCLSWRKAGRSSCQQICKESYGFPDQETIGCTLGCVYATQSYIHLIKGIIHEPSAPQLDGNSITNTSVGFRWTGIGLPGIHYLIQYRQRDSSNEWIYFKSEKPVNANKTTVTHLKAFTKYQFRLALIVLPNQPPILSDVSPWISTLPSGPPQSPPRNLRAIPLDWARIEVVWDPPRYPSGEILSYTLYISDLLDRTDFRKDVMYHGSVLRFIAADLEPNTTYQIAITAVNHYGEGPNITTRGTTYVKNSGTIAGGFLLVASGNGLMQQSLDITEPPKVLLNTTSRLHIIGLAVHMPLQLVYLSDDSGTIYQVHLPSSLKRILLQPNQLNGKPIDLTVDWLFGFVYVVLFLPTSRPSEWQIWRFDLMGKDLLPVMKGLPYQPLDLQADPYNGYLWWISNDLDNGLHRLDIKPNISDSYSQASRVIFRVNYIDSMTIDGPNFRIILAASQNNTLLSVSLDGTSVSDIRPNIQEASLSQVWSLAHIEHKFFWTNGKEIFSEELYRGIFYHNSHTITNENVIRKIRAVHSSLQSVPIPLNPPKKVQALFTKNKADITWDIPDIPSLMGSGAWQKWKYEVYISFNGQLLTKSNLNKTSYVFENLPENTTTQIKVRAFSPKGRGPWSEVFNGRTLSRRDALPEILWSTEEGIFITNLKGSKATTVLLRNDLMMDEDGKSPDILYRKNKFFIVGGGNEANVYNRDAKWDQSWKDFKGVSSLAFDERTNRIFGSNSRTSMIMWKTFDGRRPGSFRLMTPVTQISIDSFHGQLYWRNLFGVYKSTLTGRNISTLHQEDIFSGRQVYGLAVDAEKPEVWWVLKDSGGCRLFSMEPDKNTIQPAERMKLSHTVKEGSLIYANELLMWLTDEENLIIMDILLQDTVVIRSPFKKVFFIHGISSQLIKPDLSLLPGKVNPTSIMVKGTWKHFNITWSPLDGPDGSLRYEVTILWHRGKSTYVQKENYLKMGWSVDPFTELTIKIRGVTDWAFGAVTSLDLRTPSAKPGKPTHLRMFTARTKDSITHQLRWSEPKVPRGIIIQYEAQQCVVSQNVQKSKCAKFTVGGQVMFKDFDISIHNELSYEYSITASTVVGRGTESDWLLIENTYSIPLPSVIIINDNSAKLFDPDLGEERILLSNTSIIQADYDMKEESLVFINANSDIYKTSVKNPNLIKRITRLQGSGRSLTVDWIGRRTIWMEDSRLGFSEIKFLEWNSTDVKILTELRSNAESEYNLIASPREDLIYLQEVSKKSSAVVGYALNGKHYFNLFNNKTRSRNSPTCNCPKIPHIAGLAIDSSEADSVSLYTSLKQNTFERNEKSQILKIEKRGCHCSSVVTLNNFGYGVCDSLAVDAFYLYCYDDHHRKFLWMPKSGPTRKEEIWETEMSLTTYILPVDIAAQLMPSVNCLLLLSNSMKPLYLASDTQSIRLNLPVHVNDKAKCGDVGMPPGSYLIFYEEVFGPDNSGCSSNMKLCRSIVFKSHNVTIPNLKPFTNYTIRIAYETPYNIYYNIPIQPSQHFYFRTKALAPKGVGQIAAFALSPADVQVTFQSPSERHFQVHWRNKDGLTYFISSNLTPESKNITEIILQKLQPSENYEIWIRSFSEEDPDMFTDSEKVKVKTLPLPQKINLLDKSSTTLTISWKSPLTELISRHEVQYKEKNETTWSALQEDITEPNHVYINEIQALQPGSSYVLRLKLLYTTEEDHKFMWPRDNFFEFDTAGDIPSQPGKVRVHMDGWKVWWEEPSSNGRPILSYILQMADQKLDAGFKTVHNGSDNFWKISAQYIKDESYTFRVKAINSIGESVWSEESVIHSFDGPADLTKNNVPIILAATIPSSITFLGILFVCLTLSSRRNEKRWSKAKPPSLGDMLQQTRNREIELATVPHLPVNNNFVTENNILYNMQSLTGDDLDLPHIPRSSITLTKFLGSGAFGEVFEGIASDLAGMSPVAKVAIKALRKGATENERIEFMKEANLMSRFNHDHILRLLAVCTDRTPYFLILELMQGGDLLSYLRANRGAEKGLMLQDLLQMCVDVAKGCVYLEDMHFVHRDLAARNCLVSSTDAHERLVKIGDFGLARDVYKNDYYRKEGEGLLPVRWMSPESLTDGVFTTQSDVWAFGVLLWEIMTLGQQPYPARTNLEVLHYVREGGRPTKTTAAPEDLCALMEQCWKYSAESRPTFKECLSVLITLKASLAALPSMAVHNANYMASNRYLSSESNTATNTWAKSENDDDGASGASTLPLNTPLERKVQYLQLVNESCTQPDRKSYTAATHIDSVAASSMETLINELRLSQRSSLCYQRTPISSATASLLHSHPQDQDSDSEASPPVILQRAQRLADLFPLVSTPSPGLEQGRGRSFSLLAPYNSFRNSVDKHRSPSFCSPARKYSLSSLPASPIFPKPMGLLKSPHRNTASNTIFRFPMPYLPTRSKLSDYPYIRPISGRSYSHSPPRNLVYTTCRHSNGARASLHHNSGYMSMNRSSLVNIPGNISPGILHPVPTGTAFVSEPTTPNAMAEDRFHTQRLSSDQGSLTHVGGLVNIAIDAPLASAE